MNGRKWSQHQACWLGRFDAEIPCEGRMDRAHLISQQWLKREGHAEIRSDPRFWVPACRRHHGRFDSFFFSVPLEALPWSFLQYCDELGLGWAVDRRYGVE